MRAALAILFVFSASTAGAQKGSFGGTKATLRTHLDAAGTQLGAAQLKTSPRLSWTRDLLARPYSDWGIYGVGEVFKEKRSALTNLRWAEQNLTLAKRELETARGQVGMNPLDRLWLRTTAGTIETRLSGVRTAREALRQTSSIWREQWTVTVGASESQRQILQAFLEDRPEQQSIIDAHLDQYTRNR